MFEVTSSVVVRGEHEHGDPEPPGKIVVDLVPVGRVFGLGNHPSTVLVLEELSSRDLAGLTVVDLGAGCGMVAIAAKKMGAANVIAIEWNETAVSQIVRNAALNGVDIDIRMGDIKRLIRQVPAADIVICNLPVGDVNEAVFEYGKYQTLISSPGVDTVEPFTGRRRSLDKVPPGKAVRKNIDFEAAGQADRLVVIE